MLTSSIRELIRSRLFFSTVLWLVCCFEPAVSNTGHSPQGACQALFFTGKRNWDALHPYQYSSKYLSGGMMCEALHCFAVAWRMVMTAPTPAEQMLWLEALFRSPQLLELHAWS